MPAFCKVARKCGPDRRVEVSSFQPCTDHADRVWMAFRSAKTHIAGLSIDKPDTVYMLHAFTGAQVFFGLLEIAEAAPRDECFAYGPVRFVND